MARTGQRQAPATRDGAAYPGMFVGRRLTSVSSSGARRRTPSRSPVRNLPAGSLTFASTRIGWLASTRSAKRSRFSRLSTTRAPALSPRTNRHRSGRCDRHNEDRDQRHRQGEEQGNALDRGERGLPQPAAGAAELLGDRRHRGVSLSRRTGKLHGAGALHPLNSVALLRPERPRLPAAPATCGRHRPRSCASCRPPAGSPSGPRPWCATGTPRQRR